MVRFRELTGWGYSDGLSGIPTKIRALHGKWVTMVGFSYPVEGDGKDRFGPDSFYVIRSFFRPLAPDIDGLVRVVPKDGSGFKDGLFRVEGRFSLSPEVEDGFCTDIYQLKDAIVSPWR